MRNSQSFIDEAVSLCVARRKRGSIGQTKLLPITIDTLRFLTQRAQAGLAVSYEDISIHGNLGTPRRANISFAAIGYVRSLVENDGKFPYLPIPDITTIVTHKKKKTSGRGVLTGVREIEKKSSKEKHEIVLRERAAALRWHHWDELADFLNIAKLPSLQPSATELADFDRASRRATGKSPEHQAMQERILSDPSSTGVEVYGVVNRGSTDLGGSTCEYEFWSLDRVDVIIKTSEEWVGFEVKPLSASTGELRKGIYQAFKYTALMRADLLDRAEIKRHRCILVLASKLTPDLAELASRLRIRVVEGYSLL